jgi:hypothetical protein
MLWVVKDLSISFSPVVEVYPMLPVEYRVVLIGLFSGVRCTYSGEDLTLFPGFLVKIMRSCCCLVTCSRYLFYSVDGSPVLSYDVVAWSWCEQ